MKTLTIFAFFSHLALSAPILTLKNKEIILANGFRLYLVQYPSPGVVAYQFPVRAGSRNEIEKGKTGFAHFFEHLMFRGTKRMSGKAFSELYTRLGAENNAWTSFDMTNYHGVVSAEYFPKILQAEADRFQNLYFDEKMLKDEAGAVMGEYNKNAASPDFQMEEKLFGTAFTVHPYSHTTMGFKEDIQHYTERYKDVWPFFKRYYEPGNVAMVVVGDVNFSKMVVLAQEAFGKWKAPKIEPQPIPEEPAQTEKRVGTATLDKPAQTRLAIAYKTPAFTTKTKESAALELLAELEFSTTSAFQKTYLFERKWLDSVDANPMQMRDPGLWAIQLRLTEAGEAHREDVVKAVEKVVAGIRGKGVDSARLENAKQRFRNAAVTSWFESPEMLASRIAWFTSFESDLGVLDRYFERIAETSVDDIKAFAAKYLVDTGRTDIVLTGKQDEKGGA